MSLKCVWQIRRKDHPLPVPGHGDLPKNSTKGPGMGVLDRFDRKAISTWSWKWKETQFRPFTNRKITPTTGKNGQDTGLVQANLGKILRIILIYPHGSSNVVPWKVKKAKEAEKA